METIAERQSVCGGKERESKKGTQTAHRGAVCVGARRQRRDSRFLLQSNAPSKEGALLFENRGFLLVCAYEIIFHMKIFSEKS